jgi:hypothetical protein
MSATKSLENVVYDADQFKLSLLLKEQKVTFQAIDNQSFGTMELILERCVREKPDLVLLPIAGSQMLYGLPEVDAFVDNLFATSS